MMFIDGSNLFWGCKTFPRSPNVKIKYYKLRDEIANNRKLIRPYYYTGISVPPLPDQIRFHDGLKHEGFCVITRPLKKRSYGMIEKGVDVALVTDMLKFAFMNVYDIAILVSGDTDFCEAVKVVKDRGIIVEIVAFEHTISRDLKMLADKYTPLDDFIDKIRF